MKKLMRLIAALAILLNYGTVSAQLPLGSSDSTKTNVIAGSLQVNKNVKFKLYKNTPDTSQQFNIDANGNPFFGPRISSWNDITGKPSTFPPSSHTHPQSDVTGLTSALAGKQDVLGYTPENVSNKATSFFTQNNTLYPSVLAVKNYVDAAIAALNMGSYLTISSAASTYVSLSGSYVNPLWLTSISWSKVTGTPTTVSGYGITDYNSLWDTRFGTKTTDNLTEGATNRYYSNSLARGAISSIATGLTYTSGTGVFSLTSGYVIPTTTQETNWNTAYSNRIATFTTTGSSGAATLISNTLNIPTPTIAGLGGVPYSDTNRNGKIASKFVTDSLRFIDSSNYYIAPLLENAVFSNVTGSLTRVGNNAWRNTDPTVYGIGRANRMLLYNHDGYYQMKNITEAYCGIVLDTTTPTSTPTFLIAIVLYAGNVYFGLNNSYPYNTGAIYTYYRLRRSGSNWYGEGSNDEITWTNVYTYSFSYTGTCYPYALMPTTPRRGYMYEPKLYGFSTYGCITGNSTIASYLGQSGVDAFMLNAQEAATGFSINNIAVPGHTIAQQQAVWQAQSTATKKSYNWVLVEVGLNDLNPAESAATAMARYQEYIDTIYNQKSPNCKIIIATMTPCKQRLIDVYTSNGLTSWQKWKDMNYAMMNTVTKADYRLNRHTILMENANGNLDSVYEVYPSYDHIHQNNEGRALQAKFYRQALQEMKLLPPIMPIKQENRNGDVAITTGGSTISGYIGSSATTKAFEATASLFTVPKLSVTTGSNKSAGTATLSSGSVTVSTTAVTASSIIFVTGQGCTNCGTYYISGKTVGTSFVITSSNASDASTVAWWIIN